MLRPSATRFLLGSVLLSALLSGVVFCFPWSHESWTSWFREATSSPATEAPTPLEVSQDTRDLQALVDKFTGSSEPLRIARDYEVTTSIVISGPIVIEGYAGTLTAGELRSADGAPPQGKLPTIIMTSNLPAPVFNIGPGHGAFSKESMCGSGCTGWYHYYTNRSHMMSNVTIKGLHIVGNYKKVTVKGLKGPLTSGTILGGQVPGLPERKGLCEKQGSTFFKTYEYEKCTQIQELDFTRDAFSYLISATPDKKAPGGYKYKTNAACAAKYAFGCKNVKGSAITITAVSGVSISDTFVVNGNSACISAFFNSDDITLQRSRLHTAMYDGFGPDMLHSARILDSVFGPFGNAGISISNGLKPAGSVLVSNTDFVKCGLPAYLNSNNKWRFMGCTVNGAPSCDVCKGPRAETTCSCTMKRAPGVACSSNDQCMSHACSPADGGDCHGADCACVGRAEGAGCAEDGECASMICSPSAGGQCDGKTGCACRGPAWPRSAGANASAAVEDLGGLPSLVVV